MYLCKSDKHWKGVVAYCKFPNSLKETIAYLLNRCHNLFVTPFIVVPCGHSFCGICIDSWHKERVQKKPPVPCPTCRMPLPSSDYMWKNFSLNKSVECLVSTLREYSLLPWRKNNTLMRERNNKLWCMTRPLKYCVLISSQFLEKASPCDNQARP